MLPLLAIAWALVCSGAFATQYSPHGFACLDAATQALPFCNTTLPIPEEYRIRKQ